jgi:beta-fructofuranosidase
LLPAGYSRGVSAGVSEKANVNLKGAQVKDYPWNNSMLSWQRTAFHFQPEENWMNGMVRTSRYFNFFLFFFYKKNGLLVQKSGMPFG